MKKSPTISDDYIRVCLLVVLTALMTAIFPVPSFADWWIVRSSDEKCLVVDIEPTAGDEVTKIGKESYPTAEKAEADLERVCRTFDSGMSRR